MTQLSKILIVFTPQGANIITEPPGTPLLQTASALAELAGKLTLQALAQQEREKIQEAAPEQVPILLGKRHTG